MYQEFILKKKKKKQNWVTKWKCTWGFILTGLPSWSAPRGFIRSKLPIGMLLGVHSNLVAKWSAPP